jgi:SAM-dependent methyltransferase
MKDNPLILHLHHSAETEDVFFWIELAKHQGGMCLELGCGTGRVLISLAQEGYRVFGLDINFESLRFLREQLSPQLAKLVNIFQADMSAFHLDQKFSLVYLTCNTLSTIQKKDRQQVYKRINKHLVDNGIFAASIPNPLWLEDLAESSESTLEEVIFHPKTGDPIQVSTEWEKHGRRIIFHWHYDRLLPDGQVERNTIENQQIIESPEEYLNDLRTAQLIPVEIFGNFDKSAFDADSPYFIVLARKASNNFKQ